MTAPYPITDLPGADIIGPGLEDYARGVTSKGSLLVRIGRPRMVDAGLLEDCGPQPPASGPDAEHLLYEMLCRERNGNAYSEYRSLIRLLVSFENAADQRRRSLNPGDGGGSGPDGSPIR